MDKEKSQNRYIADYYNKNQLLYDIFYSKKTDALHYGIWDKNTKSVEESILNTNKFVCKCLEPKESDNILDAGCGIGGTSRYIATNFGSNVTGITLSETQIKIAEEKTKKANLEGKIKYYMQDFTKTEFNDESFDKIFGIESVCHAERKTDFIKEAFRLLKKGGILVVSDGFLMKENLNQQEQKYYRRWLNGWAVPNLSTVDRFHEYLEETGFKNIKYHDKRKEISSTRDRIYKIGMIGYPFTWLNYKLGILPKTIHENTIGCIEQNRLLSEKHNIATYGIFVAEK